MKHLIIRFSFLISLAVPVFILPSCDNTGGSTNKETDLLLNEDNPATALTIGWYLPLDYLQKIVGPDFKPKTVKADTLGVLKLVITRGEQYVLKGNKHENFNSATLLIEVNKPKGLFKSPPKNIDNAYVCPVTIISESLPMAKIFHEYGFVTEQSMVSLQVNESDDRINVEAIISSGENKLIARCFFEDLPIDDRSHIMVVNQTRPMYKYFHGHEKYNRYLSGKGRIDAEGNTLLTTLGIQMIPYFFVLDTELLWAYDFE